MSPIRSLPSRRLPVPPLRRTLDKYLKSIAPLLQEDAANGGPPYQEEMSKRLQWANEFENGIGCVLQERLEELDAASPHNWLDDNFWMKETYLRGRSSLLIHSNWWCLFQPDPTIPTFSYAQRQYSFWQVRRAAWLVRRCLEYRDNLEKPRVILEQKVADPTPYRIPQENCDILAPMPSRSSQESRNIALMLKDWVYAVEVLDCRNAPLPVAEIEVRIWNAVHDASERYNKGERATPIGVLTTHDRNTWAKARQHLLDLSPLNNQSFNLIQNAILVLSLDDYTHSLDASNKPSAIKDIEADAHVQNCSSGMNGRNRWFDKCVSLFVETSARAGAMGEHSPADGLVVGAILHHALLEHIQAQQFAFNKNVDPSKTPIESTGVQRVHWVVDAMVEQWCTEAEEHARNISNDSDASILYFHDYGSSWVRNTAKLSPDAYTQMAMQLAWYKAQGELTAIYETATTAIFIRGRTEVIRSLSSESRLFVKAMVDPQCSIATRLRCLADAVQAHDTYARDAIRGRGIDRHFLGLRLLMKEGETAKLFEDELFTRCETWRLSTSGLFRGENFSGTGFGSPFGDGYGVQYLIGLDDIKFGVESKRSCSATSTEGFKEALAESLREMRLLFESQPTVHSTARL
ncbi:acyltransferase ChoActase/COT/CPT [Hysterangium stoloniferum]|nr:acyltransferase ChoActase/COT/CPT [Hysterangium stoloniferum]